MNCGKWCGFCGTLLLFPLMRLAEEGGEIDAIALYWPWWAWIVLFSIAILAIFWWYLVMNPGQKKEVSELEAQLGGHHDDHHAEHDVEDAQTDQGLTAQMVVDASPASPADDLPETTENTPESESDSEAEAGEETE